MGKGLVFALAGRRVDPPDADVAHFPVDAISAVRLSLLELIEMEVPRALVCSAACGADLLAIDAARELGVEAHIVLPFSAKRFRTTSVVDRPGNWGPLFDSAIHAARANRLLTVLQNKEEGDAAYSAATREIIVLAGRLASPEKPICVSVSDRNPYGSHDATAEFRSLAKKAGMEIRAIWIPV